MIHPTSLSGWRLTIDSTRWMEGDVFNSWYDENYGFLLVEFTVFMCNL